MAAHGRLTRSPPPQRVAFVASLLHAATTTTSVATQRGATKQARRDCVGVGAWRAIHAGAANAAYVARRFACCVQLTHKWQHSGGADTPASVLGVAFSVAPSTRDCWVAVDAGTNAGGSAGSRPFRGFTIYDEVHGTMQKQKRRARGLPTHAITRRPVAQLLSPWRLRSVARRSRPSS